MAEIEGRWQSATSNDFLVGSLLHAWNEGPEVLEAFKATTPELYTQKGELRSNFKFAETMIEVLENDLMCLQMLDGQKEVIVTAEMFGTPWKIKIDTYRPGDAIVDLKTTRSIWDLAWSPRHGEKVSFIEQYDYFLQLAIYREIERIANNRATWLEPYIVAVSKEVPPDKAIISLDDFQRTEAELHAVKMNMPHILEVKNGFVEPVRCERCDYCRSTNIVSKILSYSELEGVS